MIDRLAQLITDESPTGRHMDDALRYLPADALALKRRNGYLALALLCRFSFWYRDPDRQTPRNQEFITRLLPPYLASIREALEKANVTLNAIDDCTLFELALTAISEQIEIERRQR